MAGVVLCGLLTFFLEFTKRFENKLPKKNLMHAYN